MRIVDRQTFLGLPAGTLYAKGVPWCFDGLAVKGDTIPPNDWIALDILDIEAHDSGERLDRLDEMLASGTSHPMNAEFGRDGMFEADAVFLVFERADLATLRLTIDAAMAVARS